MTYDVSELMDMGNNMTVHRRMWMYFHTDLNDVVLFQSWWILAAGNMVWTCAVAVVWGIVLETVRWLRWLVTIKDRRAHRWYSHFIDQYHYLETALVLLHSVLSFTFMLFFMTFSLWICLSCCLGLSIGYYFFGSRVLRRQKNSVSSYF